MLINDGYKKVIRDTIDEIYSTLECPCRLVFPGRLTTCVNCVADPIGGKPSGRWRTGGPIPFPQGSSCPLCNATGKRLEETTRDVVMVIENDPVKFIQPFKNLDIKVSGGVIQTRFSFDLQGDVQKCDHLITQTDIEQVVRYRYKLRGEAVDINRIIPGKYLVALWDRI